MAVFEEMMAHLCFLKARLCDDMIQKQVARRHYWRLRVFRCVSSSFSKLLLGCGYYPFDYEQVSTKGPMKLLPVSVGTMTATAPPVYCGRQNGMSL
nr:hypothetical protein [Tanacetum cinerariifolium]